MHTDTDTHTPVLSLSITDRSEVDVNDPVLFHDVRQRRHRLEIKPFPNMLRDSFCQSAG